MASRASPFQQGSGNLTMSTIAPVRRASSHAGHTLGSSSISFAGVGDGVAAKQWGCTAVTAARSVHCSVRSWFGPSCLWPFNAMLCRSRSTALLTWRSVASDSVFAYFVFSALAILGGHVDVIDLSSMDSCTQSSTCAIVRTMVLPQQPATQRHAQVHRPIVDAS
jgi:hypothetical protein